ncbi:MAG: GntR family transcriptional regulator [Chloroflexi bacterium]|nr:GntR family transcriptional regulator [Chloroflexota bacterium]
MVVADRKSTRLERLEPRALSRRIVDQLKRVIIAGELRPGDRVLETELAEQLGVSRGPVREAFRQLEQEGLLVSYPHRGTFVATVPEDEIEEVYALRAHLEAHAARRVVVERRDEALTLLGDLVDQMLEAAAARDLPAVADLDLQFHDTLLELSGYQGLHRIWRSMDGLVRARTYATLALPGREELIEYTAKSHRPIVEAIRSGDVERVDAAVKHHIHEVPSLMAGKLPADANA